MFRNDLIYVCFYGNMYIPKGKENKFRKEDFTMNKNAENYFKGLLEKHNSVTTLTVGEREFYGFYRNNLYNKSKDFEINGVLFEDAIPSLAEAIRESGLESFIVTDNSTALMRVLHSFAKEGFEMTGLATTERQVERYGSEEIEIVNGVGFKII